MQFQYDIDVVVVVTISHMCLHYFGTSIVQNISRQPISLLVNERFSFAIYILIIIMIILSFLNRIQNEYMIMHAITFIFLHGF